MLGWYESRGWRPEGVFPDLPKMVVCGAPHTSNWDFLVFAGTIAAVGRRVHFMGKDALFKPPMTDFMHEMGGVPVYRNERRDMVQQMVDEFHRRDEFILLIAVEGTRSPTDRWRTGFYRIAEQAGVPILCAGPDYRRKRGVFGPLVEPTGDYEADIAPTYSFFRSLQGRHPERAYIPPDPPGLAGG